MKIYRNHYQCSDNESRGYTYHSSKSDADKASKAVDSDVSVDTDIFEIELTKSSVIAAFNKYGGHPNNG